MKTPCCADATLGFPHRPPAGAQCGGPCHAILIPAQVFHIYEVTPVAPVKPLVKFCLKLLNAVIEINDFCCAKMQIHFPINNLTINDIVKRNNAAVIPLLHKQALLAVITHRNEQPPHHFLKIGLLNRLDQIIIRLHCKRLKYQFFEHRDEN